MHVLIHFGNGVRKWEFLNDYCKVNLIGQWGNILVTVNVVFLDGDNFCKAFAGAQVNLSYSQMLLQKLCKNCPHP